MNERKMLEMWLDYDIVFSKSSFFVLKQTRLPERSEKEK